MSRIALLILALAFLLAGCAGQSTPIPPPVAVSNAIVTPTPTPQAATDTPTATPVNTETVTPTSTPTNTATPVPLNPLEIQYLRQRDYPGSDVKIEQTLAPGANYNQYIASYLSDGLVIYALLTVPKGTRPATGWPVIIFNHGFIPPAQYRTTERYVAYVDAIARSGYIVFKSDYRGHGNSEGRAVGGYSSPAFTIDVLNALASMKRYPDADPHRIGMWGHSMGGQATLRAMVVSRDIKAGVIWSGVVGTYTDIMFNWHQRRPTGEFPTPIAGRDSRDGHSSLIRDYGTPEQNPQFWAAISPNTYVAELSGPLQLHHDLADSEVPSKWSQELYDQVQAVGKTVELYTYPGDDHNISQAFSVAMQRTIAFFDTYVKGK